VYVGDLVKVYTKNIGIILRIHESPGPFEMIIYDVLVNNNIKVCTTAAIRTLALDDWNESR
jgi:hypothetical protein